MSNRIPKATYEKALLKLQAELVTLQEWTKVEGKRIVVIFEGRDAAGKGSTIKRFTQYLNPRLAQIVALPTPSEREKGEWYFQKYVNHLPTRGEIRFFDRSWYNRAGVEKVMGYCTSDEYRRFLHQTPIFERLLMESFCGNTGSASAMRNKLVGLNLESKIRCADGSFHHRI